MGRLFRDAVATLAFFSVVATEGKQVSVPQSNILIKRAPVTTGLPAGWQYGGCYT